MTEPEVPEPATALSVENRNPDDDKVAFLQTQKALHEAQNEQKILREKLTALEARNRPAKWGKPVYVQRLDATRGRSETEGDIPAEQLVSELKTAQHMLENARRASEAARAERKHMEMEITQLAITAKRESDTLLQTNALHHKQFLQAEQNQFRCLMDEWSDRKSELLTQAEKLGLVSHDILHQSSQSRKGVEEQRRKIYSLATQLRDDLSKSKSLKDSLEETRAKIALIDNLTSELDANHQTAEQLQNHIIEQKQILRAVRMSAQAKRVIDEIAEQTEELLKAKDDAEQQIQTVEEEVEKLLQNETKLKQDLELSQTEFKEEQMATLVLESEVTELKAEFERVKSFAVLEGKRHVQLQKTIREEKMEAAVRYLMAHSREIHRPDRVHSALLGVREQLDTRHVTSLPPLKTPQNS